MTVMAGLLALGLLAWVAAPWVRLYRDDHHKHRAALDGGVETDGAGREA